MRLLIVLLLGLVAAMVQADTQPAAVAASPGSAPQSGRDVEQQRINFVLGNVEFIVIHELAHLAINEFDIPVIGPVEPAADYIATLSLVRPLKTPPVGESRWQSFAIDAAGAFVLAWDYFSESSDDLPYWDSHTLTIQRFYRMICLMYGSGDPQFADLPTKARMPPAYINGCTGEFKRAANALDRTLATYGRQSDDPPENLVEVRYEEPRSLVSLSLRNSIRESGLIEWTAMRFGELVPIHEPAAIILRSCPRSDAAWMPQDRELVICYELLDVLYLLSLSEWEGVEPPPDGSH